MKKIISFSLYNENIMYLEGIICNIEIASIIYPEWICRIYYDYTVPKSYIDKINTYNNVETIDMSDSILSNKMSWRFLSIDDSDVEIMLSRDADSRLSKREKECVEIFKNSNYIFHDLRDHPCHNHFMGGMFGIKKNNLIKSFKDELLLFNLENIYGDDEKFLNYLIKKYINDNLILKHDSNYDFENFPIKKSENKHFIGEVFPEHNFNRPYNTIFY